MKKWMLPIFCGMILALLANLPGRTQPEEPFRPEDGGAVAELKEMLAQREDALAEARAHLEKLGAQLQEMRRKIGAEKRVLRLFPWTPALEGAGESLKGLAELPETHFLKAPQNLAVWGPAWAVEGVSQILALLDPQIRPQAITLNARVYLAAEGLPPNLAVPQGDPLLASVQERTGYDNVALLRRVELPGVDGETLKTESEMGLEGDWGEFHGGLHLTATPRMEGGQQVQLKVSVGIKLVIGPLGFRNLQQEGVLRTPVGQPAWIVWEEPISHSALVIALIPTLEN